MKLLLSPNYRFYICEYVIIEIFKNKEKLLRFSQLSEADILDVYYTIIKSLSVYKEDSIPTEIWKAAYDLCQNIDENDTPHVALTLALDGLLWTGDKKLKEGLVVKGFTKIFDPKAYEYIL